MIAYRKNLCQSGFTIVALFLLFIVTTTLLQLGLFDSLTIIDDHIKSGEIQVNYIDDEVDEYKSVQEMKMTILSYDNDDENDIIFARLGDDKMVGSEEASFNSTYQNHLLTDYEYSHCPFIMTKFSQFRMAKSGPFSSDLDRMIHSTDRAEQALKFSNDLLAYERVKSALENGAFDNRKIVMDGDSLQRQNFISLACLAWEAGFVEAYSHYVNVVPSSEIPTLLDTSYSDKNTKYFSNGRVILRGGGEIHYYDKNKADRIEYETKELAAQACSKDVASDSDEVKAQISVHVSPLVIEGGKIRMTKDDVLVISPGHHNDMRNIYLHGYQKTLSCKEEAEAEGKKTFKRWPHILLSTSSVSSFWTESGQYTDRPIPNSDRNSCRIEVPGAEHVLRTQEKNILGDKVPSIGDGLKLETLGDLHVWHGDCLHWIQPGIPDVYAADLADYLLATKKNSS